MTTDELIEIVSPSEHDPRIQAAIMELRERIVAHYPTATFEVVRGEDPEGIYLIPTLDIEDLEDVAEVFEHRLIDMQVEEGLPVYVFPDWPLERVQEHLNRKASERPASGRPAPATT